MDNTAEYTLLGTLSRPITPITKNKCQYNFKFVLVMTQKMKNVIMNLRIINLPSKKKNFDPKNVRTGKAIIIIQ